MKLPNSFYEFLKSRIRISDVIRKKVNLVRKSGQYFGLCPFHEEKTPSFSVNDNKNFYYCFGCGAHGDVISFVTETKGLSFTEAAITLAEEYGIEIPKVSREQTKAFEEADVVYRALLLAAEYFHSNLNKRVTDYLTGRNIDSSIIKEFSIGFAKGGADFLKFFESKGFLLENLLKTGLVGRRENGNIYEVFSNRIIFPIRNIYNKVVGFGGRVLDDSLPKYINSPETVVFKKSEVLYGENVAIGHVYKKNYSILVEGYLDVIALQRAGFKESLASLGTAVSEFHLQKLWRAGDEIIVSLDGDLAGQRATKKLIEKALPLVSSQKQLSFINLPLGEDPDDVIKKYGAGYFQKVLESRINLSEKIWGIEFEGRSFEKAENKASLEKKLEEYCSQIKDRTLAGNYRKYFKDQVWQHLFNRRSPLKVKSEPVAVANYTELEFLEHSICSLMLKFPELLRQEEIYHFFESLSLKNETLEEFKYWLFHNINVSDMPDKILKSENEENIEEIVKKTRFLDLFLLLSRPDNLFLDTSFIKEMDRILVWEVLRRRYQIAILKQEYTRVMQDSSEEFYKKAPIYQEEILKLTKELQKFGEVIH
jgi:DNA primase